MKHRSPLAVFFLSLITLGIYSIVWWVKTKNEMNRLGATVPTAWLIIIPIVSIYWVWKYSEGVEQVTSNKMSAPIAFILLFLLGYIGMAIIQADFNKLGNQAGSQDSRPQEPPVTAPGATSSLVSEPTAETVPPKTPNPPVS